MSFRFIGNRISSISFLIFVAVLLIYPALQRKIQVGLWHLWNGNTTRLQEYDIPVPMSWVARPERETVGLIEVGTNHTRDLVPPIISISKGLKDLNLASFLNEQSLMSQDAYVYDRRTIEFDGERADCIISDALVHKLPAPGDKAISITCESTAGLSIQFHGDQENIDTFFSVVSQIRRHNN